MDNFKFTASNGIQTDIKEVLNIFTPGSSSGFGTFTDLITQPAENISVDQTGGQAGVGTTNNNYTRNGVDIFSQADSFLAPYVTRDKYGPLANYKFFSSSLSDVPIPQWASYLRVFLIGGGGGANKVLSGGAGEFVLKQIGPLSGTSNTYKIVVGQGGAHRNDFFTAGAGGWTLFYLNQESSPRAKAWNGTSGSSDGDNFGYGGGTSFQSSTEVHGQGGNGSPNGYGGYGTEHSYDRHYGFLVGTHSAQIGQGVVKEMNGQINYGGGGNKTVLDLPHDGQHGCACVFYFAGKPPDWTLS